MPINILQLITVILIIYNIKLSFKLTKLYGFVQTPIKFTPE